MKEKILKIIRGDNFYMLLGQFGVNGLNFLTFIWLARVLSKGEFGVWLLYLTAFSLFEMLRNGLIYQATVRNISVSKDPKQKKRIIGSTWLITISLALLTSILLSLSYWLFAPGIEYLKLDLFFKWYPLVVWIVIPMHIATWIAHANQKFKRMVWINMGVSVGFLLCILFLPSTQFSSTYILLYHCLIRLLISLWTILMGWSGIKYMFSFNREDLEKLLNFGKYSIVSTIGTHFLKSGDVFLISYFLGPQAVAIYNVPQKLVEVGEIPLRILVTTTFPQLSRMSGENNHDGIRQIFHQKVGQYTLILIPLVILAILLAYPFVILVFGAGYEASVIILQIYLLHLILVPLDRFIGVTLNSLNLPQINTFKVMVMMVVNIVGDLIALLVIGELWALALVSIINILVGIGIGLFYLKTYITPSLQYMLRVAIR